MNTSSDDDPLFAELAAMRPEQDDAYARSLWTQVRSSLVGAAAEPFLLGRFTVLGPLGGGGMGVVFLAYDPDLDRKIALKVLRSRGEAGRREVLREGRALARLRHPNVVAVFDVGTIEGDVFVAMEYVDGKHLGEWLRARRSAAETLARLIEAGRGLAAAHAVDLVHRDFKPENVVIDAQGHARVVDFGLARAVLDAPADAALATATGTVTALGGTPAYMAPERLGGAAGDRASDQYSFCVTCWEALFGARPTDERAARTTPRGRVPGWVRRVIERGLAREPARRWPSMTALLAALERGAARVKLWRAAAVVLAIAALVATAEGLRRRDIARRVSACAATGDAIDGAWHDEARQRLSAAFTATGAGYAAQTIERVIPRLDAEADAWRAARTQACLRADVERRWDTDTLARAEYCLDDQRMELAALSAEFGRADATTVRKAVSAVARRRAPAACLDEAQLARLPWPPAGSAEVVQAVRASLSQASSLGHVGHYPAALAAATRAREQADGALSDSPLWAAARAQECSYADQTGAYAEAELACTDAYFAAARAGAWAVAADAATQLAGIAGIKRGHQDEGRAWVRHAEVAVLAAADPSGLAEAKRLTRAATLLEESGAYPEALAMHERALELWSEATGPDHPDVAIALNNIGNVHQATGAYPEARALYERVLAIWERTLGPEHPSVAGVVANLGSIDVAAGAYGEAQTQLERALVIVESSFGPEHPQVAAVLNNLGAVYAYTGAPAKARAAFMRVLAIHERTLPPDHPEIGNVLVNVALIDFEAGDYTSTRALAERALAIQERALGADHPTVANTLNTLANVHARTGASAQAVPLYERSLAIRERTLGATHPLVAASLTHLGVLHLDAHRPQRALPLLERAVGIVEAHEGVQASEHSAHFGLARALVETRGDRERALVEARAARDGYRGFGEIRPGDLATVEAWLAAHEP